MLVTIHRPTAMPSRMPDLQRIPYSAPSSPRWWSDTAEDVLCSRATHAGGSKGRFFFFAEGRSALSMGVLHCCKESCTAKGAGRAGVRPAARRGRLLADAGTRAFGSLRDPAVSSLRAGPGSRHGESVREGQPDKRWLRLEML